MKQLSSFLLLMSLNVFSQTGSLAGTVSSGGESVPFANVYLENSHIGTLTRVDGKFSLGELPPGNHFLVITALGYESSRTRILVKKGVEGHLDIFLKPLPEALTEVFVIDEQLGLTRKTPYNVSSISMTGIGNKGNPGGMMGMIREVPGVYGAEFGQGIVKPFIRGLGFSRVVTIYQGNKLENHQWGADHGLGINDLGISQVEVIKGPASVLYGSGALGGVLLSKDDNFHLHSTTISGNVGSTYNSVSQGFRAYGSVGRSFRNKTFISLSAAHETHADYRDGQVRIIGNSRFNTQTFRLHTGLEKDDFQNKLSFTYSNQDLGIISDKEMEDSHSLATTRLDRQMQLPFQRVKDYLVSYNQGTQNGNFESFLHLSHHFNDRKEIESDRNQVDLGLFQHHSYFNFRLLFPKRPLEHNFGVQGSYKINENLHDAKDFLLPDAQTFEMGIYYLCSWDLDPFNLQGALRYDHRRVTAIASSAPLVDYGFILPGNPLDRRLSRNFAGFSGSLGMTAEINAYSTLKINFSTGFRAPDLAELFSNGPHPGTSRFERGDYGFGREQSFQTDVAYSYRKNKFEGQISLFGNRIYNYIFFADTGRINQNGLEMWSYLQTDVELYGMELEAKQRWLNNGRLVTMVSGAVVRAQERESRSSIAFIPPMNFNAEARFYALEDHSLSLFSKWRMITEQDQVGFMEDPTPGYSLLTMGISKSFHLGRSHLELGVTGYNLLNKKYVDHMSLLRAFEVSSPGRNLMGNIRIGF